MDTQQFHRYIDAKQEVEKEITSESRRGLNSSLEMTHFGICRWESLSAPSLWDPKTRKKGSLFKGPILCCFSLISHSCQRSKNSVFDMYCPKHICGPAFQLSKSRSAELYSEHYVSVPAPLNANDLCLSTPTWGASLTQNQTQRERLRKKYRLCCCSRTFQNG